MNTSSGRRKAQAFIDSEWQYKRRRPSNAEIIEHVNRDLPDDKKYTDRGAKALLSYLKFHG